MASKTRKTFGKLAQFGLPIIGGLVGGPAGAAVGGAAGGALAGKGALKNAAIGGAAGYGGAKLLGMGGSGGGKNPLSGIGSALSNFFLGGNANAATPPVSGMSSGQTTASSPLQAFSGMTSAGPGVNVGFGKSEPTGTLNKFSSLIKKNPLATAGVATAGAGLLLGKSPKAPELPASTGEFGAMARSGGSPLGQLGQSRLTELLNEPFQQVTAEEEAAALRPIEQQMEQEVDQVRDLYRNLRPGTDPSTDSAFQRDLGMVNDRYAKIKADTVAQLRRQTRNDFQSNRLQQVSQAGGMDQQTMAAMQQVAQWDVDQIATQFQVDYNDAALIKQFLLNEGQAIFNSQLPNQNPFAEFFNQIKQPQVA